MEVETKRRKGGEIIVKAICLVGIPLVCYLVFRAVIFENQTKFKDVVNEASAMGLGFGVGTVFHIACFIAGVFKDGIAVVLKRMSDFKDNLALSFGFAVKCYLQDMKEDGIEFLIELALMVTCLVLALKGIFTALQFVY